MASCWLKCCKSRIENGQCWVEKFIVREMIPTMSEDQGFTYQGVLRVMAAYALYTDKNFEIKVIGSGASVTFTRSARPVDGKKEQDPMAKELSRRIKLIGQYCLQQLTVISSKSIGVCEVSQPFLFVHFSFLDSVHHLHYSSGDLGDSFAVGHTDSRRIQFEFTVKLTILRIRGKFGLRICKQRQNDHMRAIFSTGQR